MNKTDDKFCPDCGHHLYTSQGELYCVECEDYYDEAVALSADEAAKFQA